jgi:hypothetical protein
MRLFELKPWSPERIANVGENAPYGRLVSAPRCNKAHRPADTTETDLPAQPLFPSLLLNSSR